MELWIYVLKTYHHMHALISYLILQCVSHCYYIATYYLS